MSRKGIVGILLISAVLTYWLIQATFLVGPGPIWKSGDLVFVEGTNRPEQGFGVTTIAVYENSFVGLLGTLFSGDTYLILRSSLIPQDMTQEEFGKENQMLMEESQALALYAAGKYLGYGVELYSEGLRVLDASEPVRRGDLLLSCDGSPLIAPEDLKGCSDVILLREGQQLEYELPESVRVVMVEPEVYGLDIRFDGGGFGGPSAGLSLALEIIDRLGYDGSLSEKNIAATGIIDASGQIKPVGGISSKVKSAEENETEIFLVPAENYEEARGIASSLQVYSVKSLEEAIEILSALTN